MSHQSPPQPDATLYVDLMSQPSRACAIVCDLAGLTKSNAVTVATLRLDRGEHRSESYARLNPLQKVPFLALSSAGTGIPESGAIIPFLAARYPDRVPANFRRPSSCPLAAARHDAAILWSQSLRAGAMRCVFHRVVGRLVFKKKVSADVAAHGAQVLKAAISELEGAWLQGGRRRFIGGGGENDDDDNAPSTADLLCLCELDQLILLDAADPDGGPCVRDFIPPGSVVEAWRDRTRAALGGEQQGAYGRATRTLREAAARFEAERRRGSKL
jgi:glutathione S-transferase